MLLGIAVPAVVGIALAASLLRCDRGIAVPSPGDGHHTHGESGFAGATAAAVDAFLSSPRCENANTRRTYATVVDKVAGHLDGARELAHVDDGEIGRALHELWGDVAPSTWNRNRAAVGSWLSWCQTAKHWPARALPSDCERRAEHADHTHNLPKRAIGRIAKTLHLLSWIDSEEHRRAMSIGLTRHEGRHSVARVIFHGNQGELRQPYREGQEDQLGALGFALNALVVWNALDDAIAYLRATGQIADEDLERLSRLQHEHIKMLGNFPFTLPHELAAGQRRRLLELGQAA